MKKIKVKDVEHAYLLAKEFLSWDERIPPFESGNMDVLKSSLKTPFQSFSNQDLYNFLSAKGAALFYFLIKNHPFQNGNKRIAITTTFVFFWKNKKWLEISSELLYYIAKHVAKSKPEDKDDLLELLIIIFKDNLSSVEKK